MRERKERPIKDCTCSLRGESSPFYADRERAALAWTEAVTLAGDRHVPDDVYEEARKYFSEKEFTLAIVAINGWNRLNISFRTVAGDYKPRQYQTTKIHA
jgi:alkylhydroperoxidase family enzyme